MRNMAYLLKYKGLGIVSLCVLSVLISGCGKKLFPKIQGTVSPPQIKDLNAQVMPKAVELSWSPVAVGGTSENGYSISRADVKWENRTCIECPSAELRQVQKISAAAAKPGPDGKLRWTDTNICYRQAFRYQVSVIDANGNSVSLSNPATAIVYPGPAAPVNVVAAAQAQGVIIQWKPVMKDLEGKDLQGANVSYRVERMSGEKGWQKASPAPVKGNSYYDQNDFLRAELQLSGCPRPLCRWRSCFWRTIRYHPGQRPRIDATPSACQGLGCPCAWGDRDTLD